MPRSLFVFLAFAISVLSTDPVYHDRTPETLTRALKPAVHRVPRSQLGLMLDSDVSVTNSQQFAYIININVGGQDFPVLLDTGSSDLWVVSTDCETSDCDGVTKYNETVSTSLSLSDTPFALSYLMGSVTGTIAFETITLGPYQVSSQVFALVNQTVGLGLAGTGDSGILGLCFPPTASISRTSGKTLLENLFSYFDEPDRFFAFKLGRTPGSADNTSSFTMGQLDTSIASDMSGFGFTPVSRAGSQDYNYWKLPLQSLIVNSTSLQLSQSLVQGAHEPIAVLDTGTTLILGPSTDVEAFWTAVGLGGATRRNPDSNLWEVRCERAVEVQFVLGEKGSERAYDVHPADISWKEGGSTNGWCMGGIQANDGVNSGDWLLGDVFLRNVYVTHHGANSTHTPMIGLLGMTDPEAALSEFRQDRGADDTTPPPAVQIRNVTPHGQPHPFTICTLSSAVGFLAGAFFTFTFRVRRRRTVRYDLRSLGLK